MRGGSNPKFLRVLANGKRPLEKWHNRNTQYYTDIVSYRLNRPSGWQFTFQSEGQRRDMGGMVGEGRRDIK